MNLPDKYSARETSGNRIPHIAYLQRRRDSGDVDETLPNLNDTEAEQHFVHELEGTSPCEFGLRDVSARE